MTKPREFLTCKICGSPFKPAMRSQRNCGAPECEKIRHARRKAKQAEHKRSARAAARIERQKNGRPKCERIITVKIKESLFRRCKKCGGEFLGDHELCPTCRGAFVTVRTAYNFNAIYVA